MKNTHKKQGVERLYCRLTLIYLKEEKEEGNVPSALKIL